MIRVEDRLLCSDSDRLRDASANIRSQAGN